ncbi:hypothetical protein IEQ34_021388 [Dendrobium chrysotoxum]|uniref:Uncharacterized protein n=1 Tax=Dendrobium chrysotoxum TaxID=161865 RepID=A0AAV7G3F9_DENCH|nr:hypothetical protein IEQ34_021388 [Dendrobium chrysotoxum]
MDPFGRNHLNGSGMDISDFSSPYLPLLFFSCNSEPILVLELQRVKDFNKKVAETDENVFHFLHNGAPKADLRKKVLLTNTSFSFKKKILAERKEDLLPESECMPCVNPSGAFFYNSPIPLHSYDPITNYTSPRPKFLRYNPKQRRELLQRIEAEKRGNEEEGTGFSPSSPNSSIKRENDNDNENEEEEELEEGKPCSYPSFEGFESPETNIQKIQGKAPLRLVGKSLLFQFFFESLVSFSQMCPIVRKSLCNLDEKLFVSLEIDKFIGQRSEEREWLMEGIRNEFSDKTEDLAAIDQDLLLKNGGLVDEQREHGDQNQRDSGSLAEEGNAKKSISGGLTLKENSITSSSVEFLLVSPSQEISDSSFTIREDKFHNESFDSMEFPWTSQSRVDESTPTGDQGLEDFSFTLASDTKLADYSSNILSEGALRTFSVFLGSLTIVVGLLSCFHKYMRRLNSNSFHVFPFLPSFEFYKKRETREKIVRKKEENLDKALDISVESRSSRLHPCPSPLDDVNVELKEVSGFGPPSVKLLGEFSLIDAKGTNNGFGSNLKKMEYPKSQVSYYKKRRAMEKLSPLADMLVSSPEESTSSRFSSKVPADKGERSDTSATSSLRRSSRLQNRNRNRNRVICP